MGQRNIDVYTLIKTLNASRQMQSLYLIGSNKNNTNVECEFLFEMVWMTVSIYLSIYL